MPVDRPATPRLPRGRSPRPLQWSYHHHDDLAQRAGSVGALTDRIGQPVTIRYGNAEETGGREACFLVDSRTIVIKEDLQDPAEIRHYILIELNHARPTPPTSAQPQDSHLRDQGDLQEYTRALDALRVEYHEWISAYLTHLETVDANMSMTDSDSQQDVVAPRLAEAYNAFGEGFYDFRTYIEMQVNMGHTANYDHEAIDENWAGFILVQHAQEHHNNLLLISENEHLQNSLLLIQQPAQLHATIAGRVNPFAGAMGTQILDSTVPHQDQDQEMMILDNTVPHQDQDQNMTP